MKFRANTPQNSKRLAKTMLKGFRYRHPLLDCYNDTIWTDTSPDVTTRIDACNHYFLMKVYEKTT